jgi:metal-dependent amidase/aminoacylase/carboxypeptidase family protein
MLTPEELAEIVVIR